MATKLSILSLLIVACQFAWSNQHKAYVQGGIDVAANSEGNHPVFGVELSFWRLKNMPYELFGELEGYGLTVGNETKDDVRIFFAQYNRIGYAYNEKAGRLPFPVFCLIGGGSFGPAFKHDKNERDRYNAGINVSWWNYFGVLGGISLEFKAFLKEKPVYHLAYFHRIGMPLNWFFRPIN